MASFWPLVGSHLIVGVRLLLQLPFEIYDILGCNKAFHCISHFY
jgi:hypothetical protein